MWYARGCCTRTVSRDRFLPNGGIDLVVNLSEEPEKILRTGIHGQCLRNSWITGAQTQFLVVENSSKLSMMGVEFSPGGAYPFFKFPMSEAKDSSIELDLIWGKTAVEARDAILLSKSNEERFAILETLLMRQLEVDIKFYAAMKCAVDAIAILTPPPKIKDLANTLGFGHKRFIDLFSRIVGITPKLFARICRFQRALSAIPPNGSVDWTTVAYSCDYFDQAHFIKDFRKFSGLTPTEYQRARGIFPGWIPESRLHSAEDFV